ncbi:hypothetical protein D3C80_797730 [compost metagenome]
MADGGRSPVVIPALDQRNVIAFLPALDHIGSAAGSLAQVGLLGSRLGQAFGRYQDRAVIAQRRNKAQGRLLEEHLDGGRVDNFGAIVSLGEKADRVDAFVLSACIPDVEIGNDRGGIERCTIGEGHTVLEV